MAPRGAGRITHSLAWHVTSGIQTGWLLLLPSQTLPGCPVLLSSGKAIVETWGGRPAARAALPSQLQLICLPPLHGAGHNSSHGKVGMIWLGGQRRAKPRKLRLVKAQEE